MILEKIFKSVYADLQGGTQDDSAMSDKLSVLIENVSLDTMDQKKLEDVVCRAGLIGQEQGFISGFRFCIRLLADAFL